jgi:L-lysine 6-transaminase
MCAWKIGDKGKVLIDSIKDFVAIESRPFVIDLPRSDGMWLATIDDQRIFDWANYYASKLIGHNHPRLYDFDYVARLVNAANNKVSNPDYVTQELVEYLTLIRSLTPKCFGSHDDVQIFTCNSGAEAMENAMKYLINLYRDVDGVKGADRFVERPGFIFFQNGFHGRTVYTLNVTNMPHNNVITRDYMNLTACNFMVPFPAIDTDRTYGENLLVMERSVERLQVCIDHHPNMAGIIIEPMQGAGGHRVALPEFFRRVSDLSFQRNVPLCFDEVQTAGGPTGTFFMCDQFDLPHPPHVVASAKKLACGVVWMRTKMRESGILDSTWSGTLSDMVRFVQEMKIIRDERLMEELPGKAEKLSDGLKALAYKHRSLIGNVRGSGLYMGFTLKPPITLNEFINEALDKESLLLQPAQPDTIRLRPNLSVTIADIGLLLTKLDRLLNDHKL